MIKKHPGLIGLPRPSFMSKTHICEYRDKLYEISRIIYNIKEIILFGELFGGEYLHPEVQKVKGASKVQKGVAYTQDNNVLFPLYELDCF